MKEAAEVRWRGVTALAIGTVRSGRIVSLANGADGVLKGAAAAVTYGEAIDVEHHWLSMIFMGVALYLG